MLAELIESLPLSCFTPDALFSREAGNVGEIGRRLVLVEGPLCSKYSSSTNVPGVWVYENGTVPLEVLRTLLFGGWGR